LMFWYGNIARGKAEDMAAKFILPQLAKGCYLGRTSSTSPSPRDCFAITLYNKKEHSLSHVLCALQSNGLYMLQDCPEDSQMHKLQDVFTNSPLLSGYVPINNPEKTQQIPVDPMNQYQAPPTELKQLLFRGSGTVKKEIDYEELPDPDSENHKNNNNKHVQEQQQNLETTEKTDYDELPIEPKEAKTTPKSKPKSEFAYDEIPLSGKPKPGKTTNPTPNTQPSSQPKPGAQNPISNDSQIMSKPKPQPPNPRASNLPTQQSQIIQQQPPQVIQQQQPPPQQPHDQYPSLPETSTITNPDQYNAVPKKFNFPNSNSNSSSK